MPRPQFEDCFDRARAAGLHSIPHAGETTGPQTIWDALTVLGAERIGHGTSAVADERLLAHLAEHRKVRNVRRDPRVALTIVGTHQGSAMMAPYLTVTGTARIVEGGAPELLHELTAALAPDYADAFPPAGAPAGFLTRIRIDKVGGVGPWAS